jgi:hypothetical protein
MPYPNNEKSHPWNKSILIENCTINGCKNKIKLRKHLVCNAHYEAKLKKRRKELMEGEIKNEN